MKDTDNSLISALKILDSITPVFAKDGPDLKKEMEDADPLSKSLIEFIRSYIAVDVLSEFDEDIEDRLDVLQVPKENREQILKEYHERFNKRSVELRYNIENYEAEKGGRIKGHV